MFGKRVRIVADRFHVAKLYRKGLENLRKKELRRLQRILSTVDYKKLKGATWALRKKETDLTDEEKTILEKLFEYSPGLKQAHLFRDQLTAIFDKDIPRVQAKHLLNGWAARVKHSEVRCFDGFVKTLMARNIKVIKRRCYGILNTGHLFQRIYLDPFGYKLYA
ncbi:transposase [uncultured Thiodictyon sp.]|uniref:transposase n=1 Tax=uncultured Thiodictyon sp. TaxID=1846217 RepID=UPI0025DA989D|nr:transposase [uncultured Thiodictyon sp.]